MTPEQLYDIHCETVGGGKMGHVHWDDLPLETRIQWGRFAAKVVPAPDGYDKTGTLARINAIEKGSGQ
tara:strand:- start:4458 stop:4661 length:204 start_codon:yes stop_codon:yes gene_type:complete